MLLKGRGMIMKGILWDGELMRMMSVAGRKRDEYEGYPMVGEVMSMMSVAGRKRDEFEGYPVVGKSMSMMSVAGRKRDDSKGYHVGRRGYEDDECC